MSETWTVECQTAFRRLAKGRKLHDKRAAEKERDWSREKSRLMRDKG